MKSATVAMAQVMGRERGRFFNFVRSRLSRISIMDAEDLVADVIHGLLKRADVFGEMENILAYAYKSLENKIIDFRRGKREMISLDDQENGPTLDDALISQEDTPENCAARLEMRERLIWAVGRLPAKERTVWIATEIEGRGFRDLAEEWDEPLGTLLSRNSRANARLRELLKDHNPR